MKKPLQNKEEIWEVLQLFFNEYEKVGVTTVQAAQKIGYSYRGVKEWVHKHDFKEAYEKCKERKRKRWMNTLSYEAKETLLDRIKNGHKKITVKKMGMIDKNTGKIVPTKAEITETTDTVSDITLLKILRNTDPKDFPDTQNIDVKTDGEKIKIAPIIIAPPEDEEE